MRLFGYTIVKEVDYINLVADRALRKEEAYREGFEKGITYVVDSMRTAVHKENINHIWKMNHRNIDDLKFLVNALLGSYAKKRTTDG